MSHNLEEDWVNQLSLTFVIEALAKLNRDKSGPEVEVDEAYLQSIALEELTRTLPSSNLKKREFSIKDDLNFSTNICADLVIFNPWDDPIKNNVYTFIEIKRTYERATNHKGVIQDIARLVMLAKKRQISTYLFLCGRDSNIEKIFETCLLDFLSKDIEETDKNILPQVLSENLSDSYQEALKTSEVTEINTKLLTPKSTSGYSCYVWRVQSQQLEDIKDKIKFKICER